MGKRKEAEIAELQEWLRKLEAHKKRAQQAVQAINDDIDATTEKINNLMFG